MPTHLSAVIPFRGDPYSLILTLLWMCKQLPPDAEVIVVDDGSGLDLRSIVASCQSRVPIELVRCPPRGRAAARNAGWRAASGNRILFNDADRPPIHTNLNVHASAHDILVGDVLELYLARPQHHLQSLQRGSADILARGRRPLYPNTVLTTLFDDTGRSQSAIAWAAFLTANVSVPRAALRDVGGFDEYFLSWGVEHFELGYRLSLNGLFTSYDALLPNYHLAHPRPPGFYISNMKTSFEYFRHKHNAPEIAAFGCFLFGLTSLQTVELSTNNPGPWPARIEDPVFFRGFQSRILASREPL